LKTESTLLKKGGKGGRKLGQKQGQEIPVKKKLLAKKEIGKGKGEN